MNLKLSCFKMESFNEDSGDINFCRSGKKLPSSVAVALGIALGIAIKTYLPLSDRDMLNIAFPGEIYVRSICLFAVPLIVSSMVIGISDKTVEIPPKIPMRAAVYFTLTTVVAVTIGLVLLQLVKPGVPYGVDQTENEDEEKFFSGDSFLGLMRNIIPRNLIGALFYRYKTERLEFNIHSVEPNSSLETNTTEVQLVFVRVDGPNMIGLIVCGFVFGFCIRSTGERGQILLDLFTVVKELMHYMFNLVLCYMPLGVLSMTTRDITEVDVWNTSFSLGKFIAVVVVGQVIHGIVALPLVYLLCVRRNPWAVMKGIPPALQTAGLNLSRSSTLSLTFQNCDERINIDCRISRFMLATWTKVNSAGTALYEVAAVIFIAQLNQISLDLCQLVTIGVTAAASGAARMPTTGAMTTLFVLTVMGLPTKNASFMVAVEWLLGICNTIVNILGDCIGVAIVDQLSKKELTEMDRQEQSKTRSTDVYSERHVQDEEGHSVESFHSTSRI